MINWKVRLKNKAFWIAFIAIVLVLVEKVAALFGYSLDLGNIGNQIKEIVSVVFAALGLLGIVNDPTTKGLGDSQQALTYIEPKDDTEI